MKLLFKYRLLPILNLMLVLVCINPFATMSQQIDSGQTGALYTNLNLNGKITFDVFNRALEGWEDFTFKKDSIITIIDYTKASHEKRLFIIDLKNEKLLYHTLVAHGKNSGVHFAEEFSNKNKSLMSSPGFYSTAETYYGKHGYSLKLDGLEAGINDHARDRLIVIHGASYVCETFIRQHGRIGRSWGCPALPVDQTKEVINLIKDGSCLYIHTDDAEYLKASIL